LCLVTLLGHDRARKVPFCTHNLSYFHPFEINNLILFVSEPFLAQQLPLSADLTLCDIPTQILTGGVEGSVIEIPEVGGLHHHYERRAA
jgi:hypothetical protein